MNKKHTFLLLFLALSLSLWGSFSLIKHWKNNNENAVKEYEITKNEKEENTKLSVKEYKGFLAEIPQNLYKKVSISALNAKTLPKLSTDIINLTAEADGYRLRPLGLKFKTPINIEVEYDENKIPEGYTEKDVLLLSFNRQKKSWERISVDEINEGKNLLKGKISQSSDFIAGIIKLPESPDTSGFTPTSISGLKAADPLSGVQSIAPPTANPEGSATTSFAIELPKGRAGMQPSVSLQYSNDGGHSWVGQGWNLSLPSVNIDTRWGAPRYDAQKETESYILSGEDLLPNTHRAEWENRSSDKIFYPRREGAFSKIIRKGNHPNNYHWEVSSKSGIISYYGNNANSVSRTASGNNAHWQISEQRDLRGNKVEYEYTNVEGVLYPKAIYYTGHGGEKGKYSVHFITDLDLGETPRADVQVSARLGLKQVYNRLLRKIEVKYDNQMVRSYELVYGEGEYKKTLLKEIRQYDADGQLFYANAMSYYNDVRNSKGEYRPFGTLEEWSVPTDGISYTVLGSDLFSVHPTLAGTSNSESGGFNARLGVGLKNLGRLNVNTLGGSFGMNWGKTQSQLLLQDLDGDNLPDKVYVDDKKVYYRKNLGKLNTFGQKQPVIGLSQLGHTKSKSYNYGADLPIEFEAGSNVKIGASVGYNKLKSKSTTESYFMDFNGDGLVDFASGGMVYYNRLDHNGIPSFHISSTGTPAPIMGSGDNLNLSITTEYKKEELEKDNPLHDVVRTWKAPHKGKILVHHQYHLIQETDPDIIEEKRNYNNNDGTPKADGVKLYFYHKNKELWNKEIEAENYIQHTKTDTISVNKDDILYFRVSSKYDGNYDRTYWFPQIEYKDIDANEKDYNGLNLKNYNPINDYLFNTSLVYIFNESTKPALKGTLKKKATTDKITLKVIKSSVDNPIQQEIIFSKTFNAEEESDFDLSNIALGQFDELQTLYISIESPTEINWQNVDVLPTITFTDALGKQVEEKLGVDFKIFDKIDEHYIPQLVEPKQKGKLTLSLHSTNANPLENNQESGEVFITAKQNGKVMARARYEIEKNILRKTAKTEDIILDSIAPSQKLFLEVNLSNKNLYKVLKEKDYKINLIIKDSIKISNTDPRYPTEKYEIKTTEQEHDKYAAFVPFEAPNTEDKFGKAFRGWGNFILNGYLAEKNGFNELLLKDHTAGYGKDNKPDTNPDNFDPKKEKPELEISNIYFMRTSAIASIQQWQGLEASIYLKGQEFSPSRLGEKDLQEYLDTSLPTLQGGASRSISMITEVNSNAYSYGASGSIDNGGDKTKSSGNVGLGGSISEGKTKVIQTMNDLNGDRFPDFISGGEVNYTNPLGAGTNKKTNIGAFSIVETSGFGGSINGNYKHAEAKQTNTVVSQPSANQAKNTAATGTKDVDNTKGSLSVTPNIALSSGEEQSVLLYMDINGDGLADRLSKGKVAYNSGYDFLPETEVNISTLNKSSNFDISGGPSIGFPKDFSKFAGSISGGYNLTSSTSNYKTQFLDLTGDGLPDKIVYNEKDIKVYPNLGNTWVENDNDTFTISNFDPKNIGKNVSISHGGSANFTIGFNIPLIPIRIAVGGGGSYGTNTNRIEATFTDVDGDGHLDYVLSEDEDDLWVAKNKFGKTNMLKGVTNGAGNSWEIDYEWKAPTYANPNAAWVLKSVKLFDGHTGDGEDYTLSKFEYEKPYYDRRERTFYGYEVVKQEAINPQDNSVLRTSVQEFYNQDYFRKSLLKSTYTLGKNGQKLSESSVKYHIANARTGATILPSDLFLPALDSQSLFIAPSESVERSYEGTAYLENKTQKEYDQNGNIVKFIDSGNGNAESQISAQIDYYESQTPYYGGIAKKLEVFDYKGLVRKREAEINPATAELIKVKNYFTASEFAQTDLEYDNYGNLKSITGAENEKGQRAKLVYTYDDATHSHITSIKDQFGYENQMAYDYRFNTPIKTTDRNGETMTYTLDAKGRIATILAPKEAKAGKSYTIAYRYPSIADRHLKARSELQPASSHTLNYDAEHNRNIETYTYADGLGRVVQVKKTASIFKGKGIADEEKHILSGKQIYDALGRVVETYYPTTAEPSEAYRPTPIASSEPRTATIYDDKDRAIAQIFPDGSKTQMAYSLSQGANGEWQLATRQTDALGRTSVVYTDAKGQKTKVVQPTGIETKFEYSAIGELRIVTDADGHQTLSEYDLLGRRTKLTHPDAGTTLLQYDKASNLIRRQTSQIREEMPEANIVYHYDFNRLQEIKYPKHPDNNVRYHYGSQGEAPSRRGRLWLVEDASGGVEYFYGDMGEVEKEIRTIRISPSEVQTYITEYEYDSWNRIQKMVYPDGERLDFGYNIAGNLTSLVGYKQDAVSNRQNATQGAYSLPPTAYSYIKQQGYDEFEQKVYRRLGNDTETTYTYDPVMRRLSELKATSHKQEAGSLLPNAYRLMQNNRYSYDLVGNILSVENAISQQPSAISSLGGSSKYTYEYDELNRLIKAKGNFEGTSNKADYELNMQYNRLNGITQKALQYTLNGQDKGYTLNYEYNDKKHPHAPSSIAELGKPKARNYTYDGNGNPTYYDEFKGFRSMVWDEENRLRGINDNGRLHLYTYDHTGERALKSSAESSMAVINGLASAVITHTEDYTAYVSPYFVVQKGKFTKHYFEGSSRIVSKLGEGTFSHKNTGIMAGGLDYLTRSKKEEEVRQKYIKGLQVPPGPPTQHGIYATPEWTGQPYPSIDWQSISQNQEPPAGWPRYPRFNEPGDVPGPPVQFGPPVTNANVKAGHGFIPNGVEEKNLYYYHPDHLGSSSYITDKEGQIIQHTEYMAFGEVLVDEHSTTNKMPYLFNGKELDLETGLYYYGARYYDAKTSIFLNVDPLVEKTGTSYAYTYNNPIMFIDPDGREGTSTDVRKNKDGSYTVVGAYNDRDTNIYVVDSKGKRTGEIIGRTIEAFDFMLTNDETGEFIRPTEKNGIMFNPKTKFNLATLAYKNREQVDVNKGVSAELAELAYSSRNNGSKDLKVSLGVGKYETIKVADGVYTTLRAASNEIFGNNLRLIYEGFKNEPNFKSSHPNPTSFYNTIMPFIGRYNQYQNGGNGYNKGYPYYGEHTYSGTFIQRGFNRLWYDKK